MPEQSPGSQKTPEQICRAQPRLERASPRKFLEQVCVANAAPKGVDWLVSEYVDHFEN
jgi:hypothetical protein